MKEFIGYCKSIAEVEKSFSENRIVYKIVEDTLYIAKSSQEEADIGVIEQNFYCANLHQKNKGNLHSINFFELDIEKIIKKGMCGNCKTIRAELLGNGMIIKGMTKKTNQTFYMVVDYNYIKGTITIIPIESKDIGGSLRIFDVRKKDFFMCDDLKFKPFKVNISNKISIEANSEEYIFCGYISSEKYNHILAVDKRIASSKNNAMIHDFKKFQKQEEMLGI